MQSSRVNYPHECEQWLNQTIQIYQSVTHSYDHLAAWASSDEINMPGFCKYFRHRSTTTREMSETLINYQVLRGGRFMINEIKPMFPINEMFQYNIEKMISCALEMEKQIEQKLRQLYSIARSKEDVTTCEFIEKKYLPMQVLLIKSMVGHSNGLRQAENAYAYDRHTMMKYMKFLTKRDKTTCDDKCFDETTRNDGTRGNKSMRCPFYECCNMNYYMMNPRY